MKKDKNTFKEKKKAAKELIGDGKPKKAAPRVIVMGIYCVIIFIVVTVAIVMYTKQFNKSKLKEFKADVNAFEKLLSDNEISQELTEYYDILSRGKQAVADEDTDALYDIDDEIEDATEEINDKLSQCKKLTDLRDQYTDQYRKYLFEGSLLTEKDTLLSDIDAAVKKLDADDYTDFSSRLDSLLSDVHSDNVKRVQSFKDSISKVSESDMAQSDRDSIKIYKDDVDYCLEEGDYASALESYAKWEAIVNKYKES